MMDVKELEKILDKQEKELDQLKRWVNFVKQENELLKDQKKKTESQNKMMNRFITHKELTDDYRKFVLKSGKKVKDYLV